MLSERHRAAGRREGVEPAVHGAVRARGRGRREERGVRDAEANLLVGHVAAALARRPERGSRRTSAAPASRAARRRRRRRGRRRTAPTIAASTARRAAGCAIIRPNMKTCATGISKQREHLEEVRQPVRVLERHRRVGVVEAAAVHREVLDRLEQRDRPAGDRLGRTLERRRGRVTVERLRHALRDEDDRQHERERQRGRRRASGRSRPRSCRARSPIAVRSPRQTAARTAIPTAAETNICTTIPPVWVR